jgi:hypothetical protein
MRAFARLRSPCGEHELGPGALIGRLASAALVLNDPRVSEAHALVSLRQGRLWLLALRRQFLVEGVARKEVCLAPGLVVHLADRLTLHVDDVVTPQHVLALTGGPGFGSHVLPQVASLVGEPPRFVPRFVSGAAAVLWAIGTSWRLRLGDEPAREVGPGTTFGVGASTLQLVTVALQHAGQAPTRGGGVAEPVRLTAEARGVRVRCGSHEVLLGGLGGALVQELMALGTPIDWEALARELWPNARADAELRGRFDAVLVRLRAALRRAQVRSDLVLADGTGLVRLLLYKDDVVDRGTDVAP